MEENKKVPFYRRIIISIKDLDKYNILLSEKIGRAIAYFMILMLIFSICLSVCMTYRTNKVIEEACNYIKNEIPDFKVSDNVLSIEGEEPIFVDNLNMINLKIIIDDNAEEIEKYKESIENYNGSTIIALKNKLVLITGGRELSTEYTKIKEDYNIEEITRDNILNLIRDNKMQIYSNIFLTVIGIVYCTIGISTFIDALALSLLALIISKIARVHLTYSQDLNLSISALTLPIILNLIFLCANAITDFQMPYFQVMYTIISYIYIIAVILIMRTDLIKKKQIIKATIEIKDLEKKQEETKEDKEENQENRNKEDEEDSKENSKRKKEEGEEGILGKAKDKVKGKLKEDKDDPEPQANIEGGK